MLSTWKSCFRMSDGLYAGREAVGDPFLSARLTRCEPTADMRSFTAAVLVLALLAAPLACQASSQGVTYFSAN